MCVRLNYTVCIEGNPVVDTSKQHLVGISLCYSSRLHQKEIINVTTDTRTVDFATAECKAFHNYKECSGLCGCSCYLLKKVDLSLNLANNKIIQRFCKPLYSIQKRATHVHNSAYPLVITNHIMDASSVSPSIL